MNTILIVLLAIFLFGLGLIFALALTRRSPEDRLIDDEDQIKYLNELAEKKKNKEKH